MKNKGNNVSTTQLERPLRDHRHRSRHDSLISVGYRSVRVLKQHFIGFKNREAALEEALDLVIMLRTHKPLNKAGRVGS